MDIKKCINCLEEFPNTTEYFNKRSNAKTLKSYCKPCAKNKVRRARNMNPAQRLVHSVRARDKTATLTADTLHVPDTCPALGIPLDHQYGKRKDNTPSVDRVDNSIGYTPENSVVISWRANRLKNDASLAEVEGILSYMQAHITKHKE
jgi:hypothetical protein